MKLYIAEKKEVATAISVALNGSLEDGLYLLPNGDKITWLSGHFLRLSDPEEIDECYTKWSLDDLPMSYPIQLQAIEGREHRLQDVIDHIKVADELVNAGDPDPEGQRLVDEVIEYAGVDKPTYRVLINDNSPTAICKSIDKMEDNANYHGLSQSALARAVGDQRYGYNLTRAYTLLAQQKGHAGVLSVGRVQTPILGLIVRRDEAIESHIATYYYTITADLLLPENPVNNRTELALTAQYQVKESDPIDEKKRIIDEAFAKQVADDVSEQSVRVKSVETKQHKESVPLPYNLLALQADAAEKFGYKPKQVLEMTQTLRDKYQAITYNRSDCRYLNDERHEEAGELLAALSAQFEQAKNADTTLKSKAFNSKKVTAHHAIIPTLSVPEKLDEPLKNIYNLVVNQYIAQFYPPRIVDKTKAIFEIAGHLFSANGSKEISPGWTVVLNPKADKEDANLITLSELLKDDSGTVIASKAGKKKTQPPKRYTISTLLKDIASAAKYVTDPRIKELLLDKDADKDDEKGGIGTPATRDNHIETLFVREYVKEDGKNVISTELGRQLIAALPEFATTPDMTALWHEKQKEIEVGKLDIQSLFDDIDTAIAEEIARVIQEGLAIKTDAPKCPNCKHGHLQKREGKNGVFWGCTGYPVCKSAYPNINDKPDFSERTERTEDYPCPTCKEGHLQQRKGKNGVFWGCDAFPNCTATFPNNDGKPNLSYEKPKVSSEYHCPKCESGLIRRPAKKGKNKFWWGCSNFPKCDYRTFDNDGQPKK